MFAGEYLTGSFPEVCAAFELAVEQILSSPDAARIRIPHPVRYVSAGVATLHVDWANPASPSGWSDGEIRILQVQSGHPARTELMVAAPAAIPAAEARRLLDALAASVQRTLEPAAAG